MSQSFLLVVFKASNELDFALPLLWKIRQLNPSAKINVLYCVINKERILRGATFYSKIFKENQICEWDFGNFIYPPFSFFSNVFRKWSVKSYWDDLADYEWDNNRLGYIRNKRNRLFSRTIDRIFMGFVNFWNLMITFDPQLIFFPLRGFSFPYKKSFIKKALKLNCRIVLYPHGSFNSGGSVEPDFGVNLDKQGLLPENCYYWYSCMEEETGKRFPVIADRVKYVGYPGLDSEWYEYLKKRYEDNRGMKKKEIRCLFIIRKFMPRAGYAIFDMEEFLSIVEMVTKGLKNSGKNVRLIVKPHPSNDLKKVKEIFSKVDFANWELTCEPIYLECAKADFVVSVPSTSTLIPFIYGIPVIFIDCTVLNQFFDAWPFMRTLFSNPQFLVSGASQYEKVLHTVLNLVAGRESSDWGNEKVAINDKLHFRKYYPDKALDLCMSQIKALLK